MAKPILPAGDETENQQIDRVLESNRRIAERDRQQSGGLSDDPTESGAPVRDRVSFKIPKR